MGIELVDTHTHLNDAKFQDDVKETVERARAAGVTRMINMGDTLASSEAAVNLAEAYDGLYAGVGIHPEEAFEMTSREDDILAGWTDMPKVVAIGEIGLDYYWEKDAERRELQRRIFIRQLDLARELHMPVCIHDRDAHGDTLAILKKEGKGIRGVLHCYSGSYEMARELIKMGWYIGVDGPLTFKNAAKPPEIVKAVPQIIAGIVKAFGSLMYKIVEIGGNIVKGLWSGITQLTSWLWDKVSGWISSIHRESRNIAVKFGCGFP